MKFYCYFCGEERNEEPHYWKIGLKKEPICSRCDSKAEAAKKLRDEGVL